MTRRTLATIAIPLVAALAGAGIGLATNSNDDASPTIARDEVAPQVPVALPQAALPIDTVGLIGLDDPNTPDADAPDVVLAAGAAVRLPMDAGDVAVAVDPATGSPWPETDTAADLAADLELGLPPIGEPADGAPEIPADATTTATTIPQPPTIAPGAFVDACVRDSDGCPTGEPGVVRRALEGTIDGSLLPIDLSTPFAAVGTFATQCARIEGDAVPEPELFASQRPTVAVLVNQPQALTVAGTWPDGTPLAPATMTIATADATAWQALPPADRLDRTLLACLTLPSAEVIAHADGQVAHLYATVDTTAVADGKPGPSSTGPVDLLVPFRADQLFVANPTFNPLGERRVNLGGRSILVPAINYHFEYVQQTLATAAASGSPGTTAAATSDVYFEHAYLERGTCAQWAEDPRSPGLVYRTFGHGEGRMRAETRSIGGIDTPVWVIDQQANLHPDTAPGWQGALCVRFYSAGTTLALYGMQVRAPRSPQFQVSVGIDREFNPDWWFELAAPCQDQLSNGLHGGRAGQAFSVCSVNGRYFPDGLPLELRAIDPSDFRRPWYRATIPLNLEYCNPDDPWSGIVGGCSTGSQHVLSASLGNGPDAVTVYVTIMRSAAPGVNFHVNPDPSHQWRLEPWQRLQ